MSTERGEKKKLRRAELLALLDSLDPFRPGSRELDLEVFRIFYGRPVRLADPEEVAALDSGGRSTKPRWVFDDEVHDLTDLGSHSVKPTEVPHYSAVYEAARGMQTWLTGGRLLLSLQEHSGPFDEPLWTALLRDATGTTRSEFTHAYEAQAVLGVGLDYLLKVGSSEAFNVSD